MRFVLLLVALSLALVSPAQAEPITGAVAGFAAWYASIGAVGQIAVQIGVGLALSAVSYGLSYLLSGGGKRVDQSQQQAGVLIPERDGLLEVRRVYGTVVVAGGIFFQKTVSDGGGGPSVYVEGRALSEGICDSLVSIIINGVECFFDSAGNPLTYPWNNGGNLYCKVSFRSGTDGQTIDPIILARFPDEDSDFRQRGICTVVFEMKYGTDADHHTELWGAGGIAQWSAKIKGLKVYDPRIGSHNPADKTTWAWSDTAALIEADWMNCAIGFGIPHNMIDGVDISADFDEEMIATLAGSSKRGTINGEVGSSETNTDVLESMSQQNRALIRTTLGRYTITSEEPAAPVCTIHQGLLVGALSYQNEPGKREAINRVDVQFYPESRFNQASETFYEDSTLIAADGETLPRRISLRFCDDPATAQRLAYGILTENRTGRTVASQNDIAALIAAGKPLGQILEAGDVVREELRAPYDTINGLYRLNSLEIGGDFTLSVSLSGTSAAVIGGWDVSKEQPFTA